MLGIEITLQDNTKVPGCIFPDQSCYLHDPICDTWGSMKDMLEELDDQVQHHEVIGPVVPLQRAREALERDYQRQLKCLEQWHKEVKQELDEYDKYGKESINLINCTDILTDQEREFLQDLIQRKGLKVLEIAQ